MELGEADLMIQNISLASAYLTQAAQNFDKAMCRMISTWNDDLSPYQVGRMESVTEEYAHATALFIETMQRWDHWFQGQETSTEPSQQSLTESASIPNLKLHGIASFEPELLPEPSGD